jgi:hypothetical protein
MFYGEDVLLRKKGGLGVVWLAGTLGTRNQTKKLSKRDFEHVNVKKAWFVLLRCSSPSSSHVVLAIT